MIWVSDIRFVKVFKVEDKGNFVKAQVSTSEKKQDGSYENSSWFPMFVGKCLDEARKIQEGDVLTIAKGKLTNVYNKEKKQSYLNMVVFEFTNTTEHKEAGDDLSFDDFQADDSESDLPF